MSTSKAQEEDMMELMSGSMEGGKRGMKRGAHDVESNIEAGRKRAKGSGASLVPSTTGHFSLLPLELDALIASYCSMKDQRTFSHGNKNLRSIMRTANLIRYKLSEESCDRYVNDLVFRDVVDSRGHVWELKYGKLWPHNPADTSLVDVSFLSRVQILKLYRCSAIIDVSPLANAHTLELRNLSRVIDVSALSSVHTLTLGGMDGVTDVSALSSVHTLTLRDMSGVTNVSALSSVHSLTLLNMNGVRDVSTLSSVPNLLILSCKHLNDVDREST